MLILFQGNTYLYQRMPDKVTEYFLFLNTPGVISGLFLCRLLAREGLTFPNIYYLFRILEEKGHKSRPNFFIISRTVYHYFSRVGRQEKCRFQASIIFNNRASYISKQIEKLHAEREHLLHEVSHPAPQLLQFDFLRASFDEKKLVAAEFIERIEIEGKNVNITWKT